MNKLNLKFRGRFTLDIFVFITILNSCIMKSSRDSAQRSANKREFSVEFQLSASFAALIFSYLETEKKCYMYIQLLLSHSAIYFKIKSSNIKV